MFDDLTARDGSDIHPQSAFCAGLTAQAADASLRHSIDAMRHAEGRALLWFTDIARRKLHRALGFSTMRQYANESLGLSQNMTYHFIHLAEAFERLPRLRRAVARGEIGWTKARAVVKVATGKTERTWIAKAKRSSRRELESEVAAAKRWAARGRGSDTQQAELSACMKPETAPPSSSGQAETAPAGVGGPRAEDPGSGAEPASESLPLLAAGAPTTIQFRLSPVQLAHYDTMVERLFKSRAIAPEAKHEDMLLSAMDALLASAGGRRGTAEARAPDPTLRNPGHLLPRARTCPLTPSSFTNVNRVETPGFKRAAAAAE